MRQIQKKGPCRNRGRLPKLTAYEKIEFLMLFDYDYFKSHAKSKEIIVKKNLRTFGFLKSPY